MAYSENSSLTLSRRTSALEGSGNEKGLAEPRKDWQSHLRLCQSTSVPELPSTLKATVLKTPFSCLVLQVALVSLENCDVMMSCSTGISSIVACTQVARRLQIAAECASATGMRNTECFCHCGSVLEHMSSSSVSCVALLACFC